MLYKLPREQQEWFSGLNFECADEGLWRIQPLDIAAMEMQRLTLQENSPLVGQEGELRFRGSRVSFMRDLTRTRKPTMKPLTNKSGEYPPGRWVVANLKSQVGFLPWDIFKPPLTSPPWSQRIRLYFTISPRKTQSEEITMLEYFWWLSRLKPGICGFLAVHHSQHQQSLLWKRVEKVFSNNSQPFHQGKGNSHYWLSLVSLFR